MTDKLIPNPDILDSIKAKMYEFEKSGKTTEAQIRQFNKIYKFDKLVVGIKDDTKRQEQAWHILRTQILVERSKKKNIKPDNQTPSAKESITIAEENIKILKDPNLLVNLKDEIQETVVREDDTIITVTTTQGLSKVKNREATSDNLLITSKSRAGKDFFVESCYKVLVPKGQYYRRSRISKTTFTYWHTADDDWDWTDKYIHLEDIETDVINSEVMRTMTSNFGGTATIVVKQKAVDLTIKGKPGIICTAYNIVITEEIRNRFNVTEMDESEEQTQLIKQRQAKIANGTYVPKVNEALRSSYHKLPKVEVVVPFSEALYDLLPNTVAMRTIYNTLLDFIKASAQIHQHCPIQRERTPDDKVIATWDDYFIARIAFMKTHDIGSIPLTRHDKDVVEYIKKNAIATKSKLIEEHIATYYYCHTLKGLEKLVDLGILKCVEIYNESSHKDVNHYELTDRKNARSIFLPLFPKDIPVEPEVKTVILDIISSVKNQIINTTNEAVINTINSNHKPSLSSTSYGFMVFMYIYEKYMREYNDKINNVYVCHKNISPTHSKIQKGLFWAYGVYEKMFKKLFINARKVEEASKSTRRPEIKVQNLPFEKDDKNNDVSTFDKEF